MKTRIPKVFSYGRLIPKLRYIGIVHKDDSIFQVRMKVADYFRKCIELDVAEMKQRLDDCNGDVQS